MHGQTCIFWANLTPFSLQCDAGLGDPIGITWSANTSAYEMFYDHQAGWGHARVRMTPRWPRSWASFSLSQLCSDRNAWANLHILGHQPNTFLVPEPGLPALRAARRRHRELERLERIPGAAAGVSKTPSWPKSWANSSLS